MKIILLWKQAKKLIKGVFFISSNVFMCLVSFNHYNPGLNCLFFSESGDIYIFNLLIH